MKTENANGDSIFTTRTGDSKKPSFHKLQLTEFDVKEIGGNQHISFKPAKFNLGSDGETWIVTSTGNFLITWSFKKVGTKDECYVLKKLPDVVNCEQFVAVSSATPGSKAPVIVAMPNEVRIEKREKLKDSKHLRRTFAPADFDKIKKRQ